VTSNVDSHGGRSGASYTQSFAYATLNRLTSGPLGSYTYGDTHHLHAATSVSSATICAGTATGQALTWDVEGRLSNWQNTTTNPTVTAKYFYDGEGQRVIQQALPLPRIPA
jgi:hypothetical protein